MGLSQLQGSPYHVVQIKRRTDEDNDPFFTRKRKKTPFRAHQKKAKQSNVYLEPGNTYLVNDATSGLYNQKVVFEVSTDNVHAKVKLSDKIFVIKKSSLSKADLDDSVTGIDENSSKHFAQKNKVHNVTIIKKGSQTKNKSSDDPMLENIYANLSLSKKQNIHSQDLNRKVYLRNNPIIEREVNNGFIVRSESKTSLIIKRKFTPAADICSEKSNKTEEQTLKKPLVTILKGKPKKKHQKKLKTILPQEKDKQEESLNKHDLIKKEEPHKRGETEQTEKIIERQYPVDISKYKFGSIARLLCVVRHEDSDYIQPIAYVNLKLIKTIFPEIKFNQIKTEELFPISTGADAIKLRKYILIDFEISRKSGNNKKRYSLNKTEEALISVNRQVPIYRIRLFDTSNIHELIESGLKFLLGKENDEPDSGFIAFSKNITPGEVNAVYIPANDSGESLPEISCFIMSEDDFIKIIVDGDVVLFYKKTSLPVAVKLIKRLDR